MEMSGRFSICKTFAYHVTDERDMKNKPKLKSARSRKTITFQPSDRAGQLLDRVAALKGGADKRGLTTELINAAIVVHYEGFLPKPAAKAA